MSRDEVALSLLRAVLAAFSIGAVWILVGRALGIFRGSHVFVAYAAEIPALAALFLPAYLGGRVFSAAVAVLLLVCGLELAAVLRRAGAGAGRALLAAAYLGGGCAGLLFLERRGAGFGNVVFCYCLTEIADSLAYLAGRSFGGSRAFPRLSPNKTWAGCLGGLAGAVAVAPLFRFAIPGLSLAESLLGGALLAVAGLAGDLLASSFKRAAGVKDFASWIPAHGGLLDVYDAVVFAAPFFLGYLALLGRA